MRDDWPEGTVAMGERVYLCRPTEADRAEFDAVVAASRAFHAPWEPRMPAGTDPRARFNRVLAENATGRSHKLLVRRNRDDAALGCMNVNNVVLGVFQSAMLGYWIGAPFAQKGYMTEALQLALALSFDGLGLHRVEANIRPNNAASIALVERAGFRNEGYSPKYLKIDGDWRDHVRYALLVDEWVRPEWAVLLDAG